MVYLRDVVADETGNKWMRYGAGLNALARYVLGMELEKPRADNIE